MLTHEYCSQVAKEIDSANIGLELLTELVSDSPDKSEIGGCIRVYIISEPLGGTLAVNHGNGWIPTYPEHPNYHHPLKGGWYSPGSARYIPRESWRNAVIDALQPGRIIEDLGHLEQRKSTEVAIERAAKLRHPFRAAVAVAILKNLGSQTVPV